MEIPLLFPCHVMKRMPGRRDKKGAQPFFRLRRQVGRSMMPDQKKWQEETVQKNRFHRQPQDHREPELQKSNRKPLKRMTEERSRDIQMRITVMNPMQTPKEASRMMKAMNEVRDKVHCHETQGNLHESFVRQAPDGMSRIPKPIERRHREAVHAEPREIKPQTEEPAVKAKRRRQNTRGWKAFLRTRIANFSPEHDERERTQRKERKQHQT